MNQLRSLGQLGESLALDRWHYLDARDGKHDSHYVEWKYFNFVAGDIAGYFMYIVIDPEHKSFMGGGRLLARIFHQGKIQGGFEIVPMDQVQFGSSHADIEMGGGKVEEINSYDYHTLGAVKNISWDFHYKQKVPSVPAYSDFPIGMFRWENSSWLIKMPKASVEGILRLDGKEIPVTGLGYSDTNWGEQLPFSTRYSWAQFNDARCSIVFGILYRFGIPVIDNLYVSLDGAHLEDETKHFSFSHLAFGSSGKSSLQVPTVSEGHGKIGDWEVKFTTTFTQHDTLAFGIASFLPKMVISEQLVRWRGTIFHKGKPVHTFDGLGFQEYSTRSWRNGFDIEVNRK